MFNKNVLAKVAFMLILAVIIVGVQFNLETARAVGEIPTLEVSPPNNVVRGDSFILTASLNPSPVVDTSVSLDFTGSSATAEDDYHVFLPLVIKAGKTSGSTAISTTNQTGQDVETIRITVAGQPNGVTVTLVDNGTCPGEISGVTSDAAVGQSDHGVSDFSSYFGAKPTSETVSLGIITPGLTGYAPAKSEAACVGMRNGDDTYDLNGYVWNDNLGFISFFCDGEIGNSGENMGIGCGEYTYGVTVGAPEVDGTRKVTGYAWNPAFGYISFQDPSQSHAPFYSVIATSAGNNKWTLSGYGWTQAGVYLKMSGITLELLTNSSECGPGTEGFPCCLPGSEDFEICQMDEGDCAGIVDPVEKTCCEAALGGGDLPPECEEVCDDPDGCPPGECTDGPCWSCKIDFETHGNKLSDESCCKLPQYQYAPLVDGGNCSSDDGGITGGCTGMICGGVTPGPELISPDSLLPDNLPVADCYEGYTFHLFLRGENGNPKNYLNEKIDLHFDWTDTVKKDQVSVGAITASGNDIDETPWQHDGGVNFKPVDISVDGHVSFFTNFDPVLEEIGHYTLKKSITSCAPTTGGNVSRLETVARALFDNEKFFGFENLWELKEENNLILNSISYQVKSVDDELLDAGTIVPGFEPEYLLFRPAYEVRNLYTDDLKDAITAYRDIPFYMNVKVVANTHDSDFIDDTLPVNVKLILDYDPTEGVVDDECKDLPGADRRFNFAPWLGTSGYLISPSTEVPPISLLRKYYSFIGSTERIMFTPEIPGTGEGGDLEALCPRVPTPTIYSIIEYTAPGMKTVKYYSNKLPRLSGSFLDNMAAIIHGTILSTMQFSTDLTQTYSPVGDAVSNVVRDTIHQNISKYIKSSDSVKTVLSATDLSLKNGDTNRCVINGITKGNGMVVGCATAIGNARHNSDPVKVGTDEYADYFYGVDVVLGKIDNERTDKEYFADIGKRILVVEGGNLLINKNIYDDVGIDDSQIVIIVLGVNVGGKEYGGNVYIADDVTTLSNVAIIADGAVHPFFKVDSLTAMIFNLLYPVATGSGAFSGEIANFTALANFYKGEHKNDSFQLFIKGAVSAKTVAGIANITKKGTSGHIQNVIGTNATLPIGQSHAVFRSMFYDWNAFRYFKGGEFLECGGGLIKDLSCGRCLTIGDIINIENDTETVYGIVQPEDGDYSECTNGEGNFKTRCVCDGIGVELNTKLGGSGDLVKNAAKQSPLARSNKPFYLYYVPIKSAVLDTTDK